MKRITAVILTVLMVLTAAAGVLGEENRIWQKGDRGEKVIWIQTRLSELKYLDKEPDGIFDEETEQALRDEDFGPVSQRSWRYTQHMDPFRRP